MDIKKLQSYVEAHPDDLPKRWQLAKELYRVWEYRACLEHLLILSREWPSKQNIWRYLAATYYRLGQYENAKETLSDAIDKWPREPALYRQLARVLEVSGERDEAIEHWKEIRRINPSYPGVDTAIKRLKLPPPSADDQDKLMVDSDSGMPGSHPKIVCIECGMPNDITAQECLRCGESLIADEGVVFADEKKLFPFSPMMLPGANIIKIPSTVQNWILGIIGIFIAVLCAWLSFSHVVFLDVATVSFHEVMDRLLMKPRFISGIVLLRMEPLLLNLALWRGGVNPRIITAKATMAGGILALVTYGALWVPIHQLFLSLMVPVIFSLCILTFFFTADFWRIIIIWLVQALVISGILLTIAFTLLGGDFFHDFLFLTRFSATMTQKEACDDIQQRRAYLLPIRRRLIWHSTGSHWLDKKIAESSVSLDGNFSEGVLSMTIKPEDKSNVIWTVRKKPYRIEFAVVPGKRYSLVVQGPKDTPVFLTIQSLLPFQEVSENSM